VRFSNYYKLISFECKLEITAVHLQADTKSNIFSYHIENSRKGKINMTGFNNAPQLDEGCLGQVPAMAYVPWQDFTKAYEPQKALMTDTIFPELDKPFYGKCTMRGGRTR
jgi:hypothetical protein